MSNWDVKKPIEYPWVTDTYTEFEKRPLVPGKAIPAQPPFPIPYPKQEKEVIDALEEFQKAMEKLNKKKSSKPKPKPKPKKKRKPKQKPVPTPPTHDEQNEEREV